jgi:hypothetical protein
MKKILLITIAFALVLSLALPQRSQAHGYYNNWWVPGAVFGGLLFGAAIARPYYPPPPVYAYPPPPPVYAYPRPVYAYPPQQAYPPPQQAYPPQQQAYPPPQSYSYPPPNTPPPPRAEAPKSAAPQSSGGEWVTVPGQYVGDTWVPPHKAWVPAKP